MFCTKILDKLNKNGIFIRSRLKSSIINRCIHSQYKVLFFGTDNFSLPTLKLLSKQHSKDELISQLEVVTSFKSRNNSVRQFANENQLIIHSWENIKQNYGICSNFDYGLVVSFGHLIPENVINSFKNGMLNVHASLLPKYRGASPIIYAIRNHEKVTGVSIMKIEPKKFDVGDILAQEEVEIPEDVLMPVLHDRLANIGAELLIKCLSNYESIQPVQQDNSRATYAPKVDNEFCKVRWNEMSAINVYDLYRAVYSFKHITTSFRSEPVKLLEVAKSTDVAIQNDSRSAGRLRFCWKTKRLLVRCADFRDIEIIRLSIGKKVMSASDFNNGFLKKSLESERMFE